MNRKGLTVAIVTPYYYPQTGGVENYVRHCVQTLCKAGFRVLVLTSAAKGDRFSVDEVDGVRVYRLQRLFTLFLHPGQPAMGPCSLGLSSRERELILLMRIHPCPSWPIPLGLRAVGARFSLHITVISKKVD